VTEVTREAVARAEKIRRPDWWLRGGLVLLGVAAVAGVASLLAGVLDSSERQQQVWAALDALKWVGVYLAAAAAFVVTLEIRIKRRRALRAIHELRAIAHIIDMHQLAKDPDRASLEQGALMVSGRAMDAEAIGQYLNFSTELLALVSKIGQLYVQDFPDPVAVAAVDQFENLATGLSGKIWQKIMILDQIRDAGPRANSAVTAAQGS
jgi:hypothetical protein